MFICKSLGRLRKQSKFIRIYLSGIFSSEIMFCKCNPLIIPTNCLCFYPFYQRQFIHFIPSATKFLCPFNKTIHLLKTLEFVWKGKKIVMHHKLIDLKILFSFNWLTLLFKMPRTSKNNYSFEWSTLPSCLTQLNTNAFHGGRGYQVQVHCSCPRAGFSSETVFWQENWWGLENLHSSLSQRCDTKLLDNFWCVFVSKMYMKLFVLLLPKVMTERFACHNF